MTPTFLHRSPFNWAVMIYGGKNPRTGFDQPEMEFQFPVRRHGFGYTLEGVLHRANDFAKGEHRTHFAVRSPDGTMAYDGPVLNAIEAPRVIAAVCDEVLRDEFAARRQAKGVAA